MTNDESRAQAIKEVASELHDLFKENNIDVTVKVLVRLAKIVIVNMEEAYGAGHEDGRMHLIMQLAKRLEDGCASHEDQTGDADWLSSKRKH